MTAMEKETFLLGKMQDVKFCVNLESDVKMKIMSRDKTINKCSSDEKIIMEYKILPRDEVQNETKSTLECDSTESNLSKNKFNNINSISRLNNSNSELSSQHNTNYVVNVYDQSHGMNHETYSIDLKNDNLICEKSANKYNDTASRNKIANGELSLQPNSGFLFIEENKSPNVNHINESEVSQVDQFLNSNAYLKTEITLDEALGDCIKDFSNDNSLNSNCGINEVKYENDLPSKTLTNLCNHKRKMSVSSKSQNDDSCDTDNGSYFNKTKTFPTIKELDRSRNMLKQRKNCHKKIKVGIPNNFSEQTSETDNSNDVPKQKPKSRQEIAVGVPNIFTDQYSEVEEYKKSLKQFLQKGICLSLPPNIDKCIECCVYQNKKNLTKRDYDNITCRFYAFRLLKFTKNGNLVVAGYPDPHKNLNDTDIKIWLPEKHIVTPTAFNIQASMKILEDAGGQFCRFVQDEREALKLNWPYEEKKRKVVWKKYVNGIREMCDVCKTTIFNNHWSCGKCGFVVCVDCFKCKLREKYMGSIYGKKLWLRCSSHQEHEINHLNITQILAGDSLNYISRLMHQTCVSFNIPLDCDCNKVADTPKPISLDAITDKFLVDTFGTSKFNKDDNKVTKLKSLITNKCSDCYSLSTNEEKKGTSTIPVIHTRKKEVFTPILSLMSYSKSDVPHMWLCEGNLLRLLDSKSNINYVLFQEQWKRGQPVLVSGVGEHLNSSLWHPQSFSRDFGHQTNDLINCITGVVLSDQPMCRFWDGFENAAVRLCDKQNKPMLLKLKDWPPSEDFAITLPNRFEDLMNCLPLNEYTHRNGKFNLASRLPECFVRPDLGPKMYTAYGNAGSTDQNVGTTNLHLDISDAVNVMVYVAVTKNCKEKDSDWYLKEAVKVIQESGCDDLTKKRLFEKGETPGALWHIYHSSDANSIRDLLNKVAVEQGTPLEKCSDPIHDQSHYLNDYLRKRLFREYGVKGYAIVQCYGDAVFIPAGAPHQVKNLHNCIKVAEDFVSPENVHHSFCMTQEFRNLTDSHTNHEDKLQIKNIVYHAVKDSISVLTHNQFNN